MINNNLKKIKFGLISLFISLFLVACVTKPTAEELASLNYGSYPNNYKEIIEKYLFTVLKDPSSKQIDYLNEPKMAYTKSPFGSINAGYAVCANINAKNSFGGYTGAKLSYFLIHNDAIIDEFMSVGNFTNAIATSHCKGFGVL